MIQAGVSRAKRMPVPEMRHTGLQRWLSMFFGAPIRFYQRCRGCDTVPFVPNLDIAQVRAPTWNLNSSGTRLVLCQLSYTANHRRQRRFEN